MFKVFFQLVTGLFFISTVSLFVAGILKVLFGWSFVMRGGRGMRWVPLPEEPQGIFFAAFLFLVLFLICWGILRVDWVRSHLALSAVIALVVAAVVVGAFFLLDSTFKSKETLWDAAEYGHLESAKELLVQGADINMVDGTGKSTPLMRAVLRGNGEMVNLLLEKGANPNLKDDFGNTALLNMQYSEASEDQMLKIVQALVAHKADVYVKNSVDGKTVLEIAKEKGFLKVAAFLEQANN